MRILQINSHHRILGGAERYYFDLSKLVQENGHIVAYFSMKDPDNCQVRWQKYFLSNINFYRKDFKSFLKIISRMFYSYEAKKKINLLLDDFKPDIVHIHNIYFYISPSILYQIKKRKIPIVQTVHDYQLITPSINFFHNGKICEITKIKKYYKAIFHRCVKNSYMASLMAVIAQYVQNILNSYQNNVDYFIAPSLFLKNKLIEYGLNPKQIIHLPNFTQFNKTQVPIKRKKQYLLYTGRLTEEKGIFFLLELAKKIPNIEIKVAGKFSDKITKNKVIGKIKNESINNLHLLGFQNNHRLQKTIYGCYASIIPSLWFENQPYSILESYAFGKPVIASSIGGIPEIVKNEQTGILFKTGSIHDCQQKITRLWNNPKLVKKMGENALKYYNKNFRPEKHYEKLMYIYKKAIYKY